MLENITKLLAIITAIIPILHLLDRAKRFSHRRNFYKERLKAIQHYQDEVNKENVTLIEKNCASQYLASSSKVGAMEVDYLLNKFPESFFEKLELLIKAKNLIKFKKLSDGSFIWISKRNKKELRIFILYAFCFYFSSILVLYFNEILIYFLSFFECFSPIEVSKLNYFFIKAFLIVLSFFIAFISFTFFNSADAALEIYDDIEIKS